MTDLIVDPWAIAQDPPPPQMRTDYYGEVQVDVYFVTFIDGAEGKKQLVPFNPQAHKVEDRRTQIEICIIPLDETGLKFNVERKILAESKEWNKIVLPSIERLAVGLRDIVGKYARVELVETGGKSKKGNPLTAPSFVMIWDKREDCLADYFRQFEGVDPDTILPPAPAQKPQEANDALGRQTALEFLKVIVQQAAKTQTTPQGMMKDLAGRIPQNPVVSKHFNIESPELMTLVSEALLK